jgi:hypothetical protein
VRRGEERRGEGRIGEERRGKGRIGKERGGKGDGERQVRRGERGTSPSRTPVLVLTQSSQSVSMGTLTVYGNPNSLW